MTGFSKLGKDEKAINPKEFPIDSIYSYISYCPKKLGRDTIALVWTIKDSITGTIETGIDMIPIFVKK